jgi:peroxiredoxin
MPTMLRGNSALITLLLSVAAFADSFTTAALTPTTQRRPAPAFTLTDTSGHPVQLKDYRGQVVLLDFWATWCHGCKLEIPWFAEFQKTYGPRGLAVVGVAMDDQGLQVVKPFLAQTPVPYRMLIGNPATARQFAIDNLPDTFLIDRDGRLAAIYKEGVVDRANIEANIKALLSR